MPSLPEANSSDQPPESEGVEESPDESLAPTPPPRRPHRLRRFLVGAGIGVGALAATVGVVGVIWGDRIINQTVLPRLEDEIEKAIDRPVELGNVERFYFWGVRLGTTTLPPTATDESTAVVDKVDVTADLRSLIFQRSLRPKITFVRPDVSLAQSENGQWLELGLPAPSDKEPLITLDIETIEVQDARLVASLYEQDSEATVPREPLEATGTDVLISFYGEESEQVDFELSGKLSGEDKAGEFDIKGKANLAEKAVKASVRSQNLPTAGFNLLLPDSVGISSGTLNGNLKVEAALTEDNKLDESAVDVRGTVDLKSGEVKVAQLPAPISDIRSRMKFKGQRVTIEDTGLQFGDVVLIASGDVEVDEGYDLTAQIPEISIEQVQALADLDLPVDASGRFQFTTQITGAIEDPRVKGRLANLQPVLVDRLGFETAVADFSVASDEPLFEAIAQDPDKIPLQFDLTQLRLVTLDGGSVTASGGANLTDLSNPTFQLAAQADLEVDPFAETFGVQLPEETVIGFLTADVEASGSLASPTAFAQWQLSDSTFPGRGEITVADNVVALDNTRLRVEEGTVAAEAVARLDEGTWRATAFTEQVPIDRFTTQAQGLLSADIVASGRFDELDLARIQAEGSAVIANAEVYVDDTRRSVIDPGTWRTAFEWQGDRIAVNSFTAPGIDASGTIGVDFNNKIPIDALDLDVALRSFDLTPLNRFASPAAQNAVQVAGLLSADVNIFGQFDKLGEFDLSQLRAQGRAAIANAEVYVDQAGGSVIERGTWTTAFGFEGDRLIVDSFSAPGISASGTVGVDFNNKIPIDALDLDVALRSFDLEPLNEFASPSAQEAVQVAGLLSADVNIFGQFDEFDLRQVRADGTAQVANAEVSVDRAGGSVIERGTWMTAFGFEGDRLVVDSFSAPGIDANGTIGLDFNKPVPIGNLALNVDLRSFDLAPLNNFAPPTAQDYVQVAGLTSFNGRVTGTLDAPRIAGNAQLNNLALNELLFESLSGPITLSLSEGGRANLQGQQDQIQLAVDQNAWPISFDVQNQDFIVRGYGEANRQLHADIIQLPLGALNIQPPTTSGLRDSLGELKGLLTASIDADLQDFSNPVVEGDLVVTDPALKPLTAQQASASFRYANSTVTLNQGELLFDDSQYLLTGSVTLSPDIQYQGELTIPRGQIEDLVAIVDSLDLSALGPGSVATPGGSAADLVTQPVGLPKTTFLQRLESFVAFAESQPEDTPEDMPEDPGSLAIPPLEDLEGEFTGAIQVAGNSLSPADLTADFNLQGSSWEWGRYTPPNQFLISGDIKQQTFSLDNFTIDAGETQVDFTATANIERLEGQLSVENLPIVLAELVYPLPIDVAGDLDINASFDGSLSNPILEGSAAISEAQLGDYPLDRANANFSYRNSELALAAEAALEPTDEPITVEGNLLYAFPFMVIRPPVETVQAIATIPSDSFDFINTLTEDRVRWEGGTGEVVVQVDGSLQAPVVVGQASVREGLVSSIFLEDDFTDINGDIQFDLTQVGIQQLQANMGDGQVVVSGQLPLLASGQSVLTRAGLGSPTSVPVSDNSGIAIALDDLPVDYDGAIEAVLAGRLLILGAALSPTISGSVNIDDGQVFANRLLGEVGSRALPANNDGDDNGESEAIEVDAEEPLTSPCRTDYPELAASISPCRVAYLGLEPADVIEEKPKGFADDVVLQNLEIALGDRLNIIGRPLYNLTALGSLAVNGTLSDVRPEGTIALRSGLINLFSTQFRLDKNAPNTATFIPENGLDPILDVALKARVRDRQAEPAPPVVSGFATAESEVSASVETVGEVEFIRVEAIAQGPASEIVDNLTITSSDGSRSQGELLALLGRGAYADLTTASLTQLTGFLGAGTLANFGNTVADVVGLKSFSVFPTTDTSPNSSVGVGIGVEATAGIGNRFDISVLEILNSNTPPQLGVEYRFTDNLELRGSSNLDESIIRIEYNIDF